MKKSLGHPATEDAYYPRNTEVKQIYKVLKTGTSIYLSAPRRVGKTSILLHLQDNPASDFYFIYIITESVYSKNEFYKRVFEDLLKSKAIGKLTKLSKGFTEFVTGMLGRVQEFQGVKLREGEEPDYYHMVTELLSKVSDEYSKVIIMIDEFSQTIQNIMEKGGKAEAQNFIQSNRELRHHRNLSGKISFIYTGSLSLIPIIDKITALTAINDLRTVEVNPLSEEEAKDFLKKLMTGDEIKLSDKLIEYTLGKIKWFIPFHIVLIQQEIMDVTETTGKEVDKKTIDKAFEQIVHSRNSQQFEPYFSRLKKMFKKKEYEFVMEVLKYIAINDTIPPDILNDKAVKYGIKDMKYVTDILMSDGYITEYKKAYRYNSPLLQAWCKKHICQ